MTARPQKILVVDDKQMMRDSVGAMLQRAGFDIVVANDGRQAMERLKAHACDAVISDLMMPELDGMGLLAALREAEAAGTLGESGSAGVPVPLVLMTAYGGVTDAVAAMQRGAFDFIQKPFEGDQLVKVVQRAVDSRDAEVAAPEPDARSAVAKILKPNLKPKPRKSRASTQMVATSQAMRAVLGQIEQIAASSAAVLVNGESGTGKEVVAREIHRRSPRASNVMLCVNCAALSSSLLESELFGHERGAFTGADQLRKGRFELADGGTLLLDEISEISPTLQAKLLRVLQEGQFERVGSSKTLSVDVRIVATSNRDLRAAVADGSFRQDLYYRLAVLPVDLPALRTRTADVVPLSEFFLKRVAKREGAEPKRIEESAKALLELHPWPGNVRELQNICERAAVLSGDGDITADLIRPWLAPASPASRSGSAASLSPSSTSPPPPAPASASPLTPIPVPELDPGTLAPHSAGSPALQPPPNVFEPAADWGGLKLEEEQAAEPLREAAQTATPVRPLADIEREEILSALNHFDGNRTRTAEALDIGLRTLGMKLKKWKAEGLCAADV